MQLIRIALTALLSCIAGVAFAQVTLTIASWTPPTHLMTTEVTNGWAIEVEKATQGRVKFRALAKHPSAPPGSFDAVQEGLVDVSFTGPNYTPARHVVTMLPELPGGGTTSLVNSVAFSRVYWKHLDKANEFKGVKLLTLFTHGPGHMFNARRPVKSVSDLAGMKIRTGGGVAEKMANALGVSSLVKPAPESYELLANGIIDGVFFPLESVPAFKLEKLIKHATLFPGGFYSVAFAFIMNEEKWKRLPPGDQQLILSVSGEAHARVAGRAWDAADKAASENLAKAGVVVAQAPPAMVDELRAKAVVLEREWIGAVGAKGIDGNAALAEFRSEIRRLSSGN
jgi:TRAP-type transport system periplasmic protein